MSENSSVRNNFFVPIAIVLAGAIIAGAIVFTNSADKKIESEALQAGSGGTDNGNQNPGSVQQEEPQPGEKRVEGITAGDDPTQGDPNAPVEMIEFSDYECPFCGRYIQGAYKEIKKNYVDTGKVKYTFKDYPLPFHADAKKAAIAANCAGEQGKYWEMHDELFANNTELAEENLSTYAKNIGLNISQFDACLSNPESEQEIDEDLAEAQKVQVSGTPTFYINGREIVGALPYSEFEKVIEEELSK